MHGQWFGVQYLILDLKTLNDSEDFIFWETTFNNFAPRFIIDQYRRKLNSLLLARYPFNFRTHLRSSWPQIFTRFHRQVEISSTVSFGAIDISAYTSSNTSKCTSKCQKASLVAVTGWRLTLGPLWQGRTQR